MNNLQVFEIMTRNPVTVGEGSSIKEAANKMKSYRVSSLLILGENNNLLGIITVDDIVRLVVAPGLDVKKTLVDQVMTKRLITVDSKASIEEVISLFVDNEIRQIPIVDKNNKLEGFVTLKDILRFEPAMLELAVDSLRLEEEHRQKEIRRLMNSSFSEVDSDDEDLFN